MYKITVTLIEDIVVESEEWVEVDPYKDEEGKERSHDYRTIKRDKQKITELYTQQVDTINLKGVIAAVNPLTDLIVEIPHAWVRISPR